MWQCKVAKERNVKTNLFAKCFQMQAVLMMVLLSSSALADNAAPATPTQPASQASTAQANDSQCPCDFSDSAVRTDFTRINKGSIDCTNSNTILRLSEAPAENQPKLSIVITSIGTTTEGADVMNVWGIAYTIDQKASKPTFIEICAKSLKGVRTISNIMNKKQHEACISDLIRAAGLLGVRCEDK